MPTQHFWRIKKIICSFFDQRKEVCFDVITKQKFPALIFPILHFDNIFLFKTFCLFGDVFPVLVKNQTVGIIVIRKETINVV